MSDGYIDIVNELEKGLKSYAKKSFEPFSTQFLGGDEIEKYFSDQWQDDLKKARISKRTPLQIERDRILYSNGMRKLNEKNHVLFSGNQKIVRNYTTHTMRMAQVSRAISRGLGLNEDFAEGIALGAKVGSIPFVHISKMEISKWIQNKVTEIDNIRVTPSISEGNKQLKLFLGKELEIPTWLDQIKSTEVNDSIAKFFPWGGGNKQALSYSSGKQGYWMLSSDPYCLEARLKYYSPEMMYGIWRHSLQKDLESSFYHKFTFPDKNEYSLSSESNDSFEATVVRYADDITWVIENINDAHQVAQAGDQTNIFKELDNFIGDELPSNLSMAITRGNPGLMYTYFIDNFVTHSETVLNEALKSEENITRKILLGEKVQIGLSVEAATALLKLKDFLNQSIFGSARIENRNKMLATIANATMGILWDNKGTLWQIIEQKGRHEGWTRAQMDQIEKWMSDDIYKIQIIVNAFSEMSDSEVFHFIGIESF